MTLRSRVLALIAIVAIITGAIVIQPAVAAAADTTVVPVDRRTVWNPGIPGGIPGDADATRPASVWLPTGDPYGGYSVDPARGDGSTDATSAINNAIDSAGSAASSSSRRIVLLAPGRYLTNGIINLDRSNVTVRGSGQGVTIIDHQATSDWAAIDIGNTVGDFSQTPVVNVPGGAAKGASQITVADASGFNVGDILQIDQLADGTPDGPSGWVWILDSWWSMRSPYANYPGGGGLQGKFPDSPDGYRPISQRIEVLAKNGNTLTIYDPATGAGSPLHVDFPASQDPEVWLAAGAGASPVHYAGLESLSVWSAAASGDAKDMVAMNGAAYSWIRDVETDGSKNTWAGRHIHILNAVYRAEVRETYVHNSSNYNQGANAYGILYSGSECLIEDNIVRELNKPVVGETSGGGNVIAYNYVDEAVIGSLTNSWQETAINMSHASFCHSDLFEGNHTPNVGVDSTHGNNGWGTFFRNWATGRNSSEGTSTYLRAIYVDGWQREMTSIGNVLGSPTFNPDYLILSPASGINPVFNGPRSIYLLGSNAWELGTGRKPGADYWDDGQAEQLFYRHLDYDYYDNSQYTNPSNPVTALPDSLYLTAKPAFFGSLPWPWVDPTGASDSDRVKTLPARARYDAIVDGPSLSIDDVALAEGDAGTQAAPFTVTLSAASGQDVSVGFATANGTATAGSDYTTASGTLTFSPGSLQQTISVTVIGDTLDELDETFYLLLSNASGATIADDQAVGTIIDDDDPPLLVDISINDVSVAEGDSGSTDASLSVTLSAASTQIVTVDYTTANGSATAGSDYTATAGSVSFSPGETTQPILVSVTGDTVVEPDETFVVNLSNPIGATLVDSQGQVTITNDDAAPPSGDPVVWTSAVGVSVAGNSLTKTAANGWNAGAVSDTHLASGDGYVELIASETNTYRMLGLSNGDTNASYEDIDFGLDLWGNGQITVYENGVYRGNFGPYVIGDIFRVGVVGGVVEYSRNGTVFYTSSQTPVYPLLVDTSLYNTGSTLSSVVVSGFSAIPAPVGDPVAWTSAVGVSVAGNSLTKTAANGWNAGAVSDTHLASGDGYVELIASETNTYRMLGLSNGDTNASYEDIDFGLDLWGNGQITVYENGVYRGNFGPYVIGDIFRVGVVGGVVEYSRNGTVFYTSSQTPVYPLLVDTSLYNTGSTLSSVVVSGFSAIPAPVGDPVAWTSAVGVSVAGNSLTKTAAAGWNAGAVSDTHLASGDGYVEFVASETNTFRLLGLSNGNTNASYQDVDFGLDLWGNGQITVYENGVSRGNFGAYATGDKLRVAVVGSVVEYSRNGTVFYTSSETPVYPLLVDTSLYNTGATLSSAVVSGFSAPPPPPPSVVWTSAVGVSVAGNSLTKTGAAGWNAGAVSSQQITSGDGYVEFTASETNTFRLLGLSNGNTDASYQDIDFGLDIWGDGQITVYENGVYRGTFGAYATGDKLRVAVVGSVVEYSRNGTVFYTSSQTPVYPLLVDTSLYNTGATLSNVIIDGAE